MANLFDASLLEALSQQDPRTDFDKTLFQLAYDLGFTGICIGLENNARKLSVVTNFNAEYMATYQKNNFHWHDHVVAHCRQYDTPVNWQDSYPVKQLSRESTRIINTSADFGIVTGLAVPVAGHLGRGLVSLQFGGSRKDFARYSAENLLSIVGFCQTVMWRVSRELPSSLHQSPYLTHMENECLKYVADGLSNRDIASLLSVSVDRIKELVSSLLKKLEAANRTEMVMQAFRWHILQ